jgi:uncharacterized protein YecT (DUF1311 family)
MSVEPIKRRLRTMPNTRKDCATAISSYPNRSPDFFANARRVLLSLILAAVVVTLSAANKPAEADVMQAYFKTSCEAANGIARIEVNWAPLGSPPKGFPYTPDNIPGAPDKTEAFLWNSRTASPFVVCNLGLNRLVAIKGYTGPKRGPGAIGFWLYIGGRLTTRIQLAFFSTTIIKREQKDFYVDLMKCNEKEECQSQLLTSPSFQCDKASSPIEKGICVDNTLCALDAEVNTAYQKSLSKTVPSTGDVFEGEGDWLKKLSLRCLVPHADPTWHSQPYLAPEQAECVDEQYKARLQAIESLNPAKSKP